MIKVNLSKMFIDDEIKSKILAVYESGRYIKGEENSLFEGEFADYCKCRNCTAVNSGTSALILGLMALGIGKGDEVILPSHTFIASANAVLFTGATPIFAEIQPNTYTVDCESIESLITPSTKAIMPVHIYGHPCDMLPILDLAEDRNLFVIEDACQAHGAKYKGKKCGSVGDVAAFSFFPSKNMTVAGDGGALTTNNDDLAIKASAIRDQGRKDGEKYYHEYQGLNMRLSEIHAAIGRIQLKHLDEWNAKRRDNASYFNEKFDSINEIILPQEESWAYAVYHQYVIRTTKRDALLDFLKKHGIESGIHYPVPVHLQPAMRDVSRGKELRVTESVAKTILSIPIHPHLKSEEKDYIANEVIDFFN